MLKNLITRMADVADERTGKLSGYEDKEKRANDPTTLSTKQRRKQRRKQ